MFVKQELFLETKNSWSEQEWYLLKYPPEK